MVRTVRSIKMLAVVATLALGSLVAALPARAGGVSIGVSVGGGYCSPPVVYQPAYCPPPAVYAPAPTYYYAPAPTYYYPQPVVVAAPAPTYYSAPAYCSPFSGFGISFGYRGGYGYHGGYRGGWGHR